MPGLPRPLLVGLAIVAATTVAEAAPVRRVTGSIVNGVPTRDHPAVGALLWGGTPGAAQLLCTGTMIGCRTFLTAGHCVDGFLAPEDYAVYLPHIGLLPVASVSLHPDHDFPEADVAVLLLADPVTAVRPVPVDLAGGHPLGTSGTIVGFGEIGGAAGESGLVRRGAVSIDACTGGISDVTSICWQFDPPVGPAGEDSNTCRGDSGGPLLVATGDGEVVAGVTSGGAAADCLAPDRSFDARVSFYGSWIAGEGGPDLASTRCGAGPQVGESGATVVALDGTVSAAASESRHEVVVPADAAELRVTMNGVDDGSNFDLYVKHGAPPTTTDFDCAQTGSGQFGACTVADPAAGTWHVLVRRFFGEGDYQATATILDTACAPEDEGLPCDDADACTTGETCQAGACTGGAPVQCDDGVACTLDACHPATGCLHPPDHGACAPCDTCVPGVGCMGAARPDCRGTVVPLGAKLKLKVARDLLLWKLTRADATSFADFADPAGGDDYRLCLYDEAGAGSPILRADAPGGGACAGSPCWTARGTKGFKYADRDGTPDGVSRIVLRAGDTGRAKMLVKAKGANLPSLPATPLALPLRVQLRTEAGACWESTFTSGGVSRNDGGVFVGHGD